MTIRLSSALAVTLLAAFAATGNLNNDLIQAVQNNNTESVRKLLSDGADVNAKDTTGATALMHAAAYASPELMTLLLDKGADPKAKNSADATALMWGIGDLRKVKLLIERGADVNAQSNTGKSPLLLAARHHGGGATVKHLLSKGADVKQIDRTGQNAVTVAASAGDFDMLKMLLAAGGDLQVRQTNRGFAVENTGSEILDAVVRRGEKNAAGVTALMAAVGGGNPDAVRLLLERGADVNAVSGTDITALMIAAPKGSPALVKALLDHGANVNVKDERGLTPLILASGAEARNVEVVRLIVAKGADLKAKDENGDTALDWALKSGDTAVARMLRQTGATASTPKPPARPEGSSVATVSQAVERSLRLLESNGTTFLKKSGCISCHNVSIPLMAITAARERGFKVDEPAARQIVKIHAGFLSPHRENLMQSNCTVPGITTTATYSLIAMKAEGYGRDRLTDAIVHCLAEEQRPGGEWRNGETRPPLGSGEFSSTALSLRAIDLYMPPGRKHELGARLDRARKWLLASAPATTDDRVYKLFGLKWAGADPKEIERAVKLLAEEQRADGGWAQLTEMPTDAFATGTALAALHQAGGMKVTDRVYQRGMAYLLKTQIADGSWHVRTRAFGFQPYFESGFPHGPDQWISAAATSWATIALSFATESKQIAQR